MSMRTPLVFFHSGFDPYLAFTIWQARKTNPDEPVWLIGDRSNDLSSLGANHFIASEHGSRREEFVRIYQHLSNHQLENERLCFERWFYLEALLRQQTPGPFCFMDSDYFLLDAISSHIRNWEGHDLAGAPVWGFAWFPGGAIITEFCDFMLECYSDPRRVQEWRERYQRGEDFSPPEKIHNVCDMTLWRIFIRERNLTPLDLSVPRNGIVFDSGLSFQGGFEMQGEYKRLSREDGKVYGTFAGTRERVRFAALHLNGKYPKRIQPLFTGCPWPVLKASLRPSYRRNARKLLLILSYAMGSGRQFIKASSRE